MARPTRGPEPPYARDPFLETASAAARLGGEVLRRNLERRDDMSVTAKGRNDFVTRADREAEEAVVTFIRSRHPGHALLTEESPPTPGSEAEWIIDPLDGTTNFIHRYPFFATSVAVRTGSEVVACGRLDGFWECSLSAWDIAAGALIIEEAGGLVTDFEGARRFLDTGDIVASSPSIHPDLLGAVRRAFR